MSTVRLVLLVLGIAFIGFLARTALVRSPEKDASGIGRTLRGTVVDAQTGDPIAGARVVATSDSRVRVLTQGLSIEARTNGLGEFTVPTTSDSEFQDVSLEVNAPGYQAAKTNGRIGDEHLRIALQRSQGG